MKNFTLLLSLFASLLLHTRVHAIDMNDSPLNLGIFAGANGNQMTGLPEMIVPENYYTGYTLESQYRFGFTGGLFLNYRASHLFGFQPELSFAMQHGQLHYSDINDLTYDLDFKYNYLNAGIGFKFYPWRNLFLSVTPQVGFNLTADNLFYRSNGEDLYGPDLETQQLMRNVIKGRTHVSTSFGLGYQFLNRIYIDARYQLGLSDMIETMPNSYRFAESRNKMNGFQLTIGYTIFSIK